MKRIERVSTSAYAKASPSGPGTSSATGVGLGTGVAVREGCEEGATEGRWDIGVPLGIGEQAEVLSTTTSTRPDVTLRTSE
jgi:hypothetical protein